MSLSGLIELFYALALGAGLEHLGGRIFESSSVKLFPLLPLSVGALAVGIGDWLIYYVLISPTKYVSIWRVLMDVLIVTLIFFLFESAERTEVFAVFLAVYFSLGAFYYVLLQKEEPLEPQTRFLFVTQCLFALLASLLCVLAWRSPASRIIVYEIAGLGFIWGVVNVISANKALVSKVDPADVRANIEV